MNGRAYFARLSRRLHLDGLTPDAIQHLPPLELERGAAESKLGGRITRDLPHLPPDVVAERRALSEDFLKQPVEHVAAEEDEDAAR